MRDLYYIVKALASELSTSLRDVAPSEVVAALEEYELIEPDLADELRAYCEAQEREWL